MVSLSWIAVDFCERRVLGRIRGDGHRCDFVSRPVLTCATASAIRKVQAHVLVRNAGLERAPALAGRQQQAEDALAPGQLAKGVLMGGKRRVEVDPNGNVADGSAGRTLTRSQRVDVLNAALKAAEAHLYELNLGVAGQVVIDSDTDVTRDENGDVEDVTSIAHFLRWDRRGNSNKWMLTIRTIVDGEEQGEATILEAKPEHRKLAAEQLPNLLAELKANAEEELGSYDNAAAVARLFAQGHFDDVEPAERESTEHDMAEGESHD